MGRALPGVQLAVVDGELVADPATRADVLPGLSRRGASSAGARTRRPGALGRAWRIVDRGATVRGTPATACTDDDDGYLYFEGRTDDVIVSAGYRIGPFEVESALVAHPAVAEAAAVAAPDEERGSVVRAVVVLRDGARPLAALARELQEHVKRETAPYKYPRIVDFVAELPKTSSGKVKRALLRG